jgi:hypothetical protein
MTREDEQREADWKMLLSAYRATFGTADGIRVLNHLKKATNFHRAHFGGKIDVNSLIAEEARRGLVLEIIANVEANPDTPEPETAITQKEE